MMEKFFERMMEEKHDFYHYMRLYEECDNAAIRGKLHAIASQEVQHYKELYDIVFEEKSSHVWTPIEEIIQHQAKHWYEEMVEELKHFGK